MSEHGFWPLELQSSLHDGYRRVFRVASQELLLLQHAGQLHLFELHSGACTYSTEGPCRGLYRYALSTEGVQVGVQLPLQPLQSGPFQTGKGT